MQIIFKDESDKYLMAAESDQVPDVDDVVGFPNLTLGRVLERRWNYVNTSSGVAPVNKVLQVNILVSLMTD